MEHKTRLPAEETHATDAVLGSPNEHSYSLRSKARNIQTTEQHLGRLERPELSPPLRLGRDSGRQCRRDKPLPEIEAPENYACTAVQSYVDCGLDVTGLRPAYETQNFDPLAVYIGPGAPQKGKITKRVVEKLRKSRDEMLEKYWPKAGDENDDEKEAVLMRRLCDSCSMRKSKQGILEAMKDFCERSRVARDEARLYEFLKYSILIITKQLDQAQVSSHAEPDVAMAFADMVQHAAAIEELERKREKHGYYRDCQMSLYYCVHYILSKLNERWKGWHLLVALFLRKYSRLHHVLCARAYSFKSDRGSGLSDCTSRVPHVPLL